MLDEQLKPESVLSHYRIVSFIGAGGMGEVYLAEDSRLSRRVALKRLPRGFAEDRDRLHRFEQEARAVSALNHPNIVTIHEVGTVGGEHFLVTEFIEGQTLRGQLTGRGMSLERALDIAIQTAAALSAAHAAAIVHRDVKPENIMLRRDGYVKVLDFGLAKLAEPPATVPGAYTPTATDLRTEAGVVLGTVRYMAPEQARGLKVDARSDIFSLGVVLYEMVAGRVPFEGATAAETLAAILEREPPSLRRFAPEVPDELQRIVGKTLAKEREERYQTVRDLEIDLRNLRRQLEFEAKRELLPAPGLPGGSAGPSSQEQAVGGTSVAGQFSRVTGRRSLAIVGLAVLAAAAAALIYIFGISRRGAAVESLAVLPFANVGTDSNIEYLSDGITDSLIIGLSQLPRLKVMSRNSVFRYKGREPDAQLVGKELGVRAVLTGRIVVRGDGLSIRTELVDTADNSHLWGEQYDRKMPDLPALQTELSRDISEKLRLKLSGDDRQRLAKRSTGSAEAYDLYLKGRYYLNALTNDGARKALEYFQKAVAVDPGYALAWAGLAECYTNLASLGTTFTISPDIAVPKAKAAALKALELDDTLAEAHTSLGLIAATFAWDRREAEGEFQRAIALNPNYVNARHWYSHCLVSAGRFDESLVQSKQALMLDPLDTAMNLHLGFHYLMARHYDAAVAQVRRTLEMDPNNDTAHGILGMAYAQLGRYSEAAAEIQRSMELGGLDQRGYLGHVLAISGRRDEARKLLEQLMSGSGNRKVSPHSVALIYAGLGEKDQALAALERAVLGKDPNAVDLKVDPSFDNLRSDPRFGVLVQRMGLSP